MRVLRVSCPLSGLLFMLYDCRGFMTLVGVNVFLVVVVSVLFRFSLVFDYLV